MGSCAGAKGKQQEIEPQETPHRSVGGIGSFDLQLLIFPDRSGSVRQQVPLQPCPLRQDWPAGFRNGGATLQSGATDGGAPPILVYFSGCIGMFTGGTGFGF